MKLPPFDITITPSTNKKDRTYSHIPLIKFDEDYTIQIFRTEESIDYDQDLWNKMKIFSSNTNNWNWFYLQITDKQTGSITEITIGDSLQYALIQDYLKGKHNEGGKYIWTPSITIDDCFICLQNYIEDNYPTIVRYRYIVDTIVEKNNIPPRLIRYEFSFSYDAIEEVHVYHKSLVKLDKSWTDSPLKANISGKYNIDVSSGDEEIGFIYEHTYEAVNDKIGRFYPDIIEGGRILDETENRYVVSRISGVKCKSVTIRQTAKDGIKGATISAGNAEETALLNEWIKDYLLSTNDNPIIYVQAALNALFSLINRNSSRSVGIRELIVYTDNFINNAIQEEIKDL